VAESEFVKDWRRYATGGHRLGGESAGVTIVEFADFQCPFCRRFAASVDTMLRSKPGSLRIIFHQFPLTDVHPFALSMAIASECASAHVDSGLSMKERS
jgi:protein-disulfide isomerase